MNRKFYILFFMILLLLTGCFGSELDKSEPNNKSVDEYIWKPNSNLIPKDALRIATTYTNNIQISQLINFYQELYPSQSIEVVEIPFFFSPFEEILEESFLQLKHKVLNENFDIVIFPQRLYQELLPHDVFSSLIDLTVDYDLDYFHPIVNQLLTANGSHELKGLSPIIHSKALVFNLSLFNQTGIQIMDEIPTWSSLYSLAASISKTKEDDQTYGLTYSNVFNPNDLIFLQQSYRGLDIFDPSTGHVTITSDAWREVYDYAFNSISERIAVYPTQDQPSMNFTSGKSAILFADTYVIEKLKSVPFKWISKSIPMEEGITNYGLPDLPYVFAIPTNSTHKKDAELFIKVVNSEESLKELFSDSSTSLAIGLPTRKGILSKQIEEQITGFLPEQLPVPIDLNSTENQPSRVFFDSFYEMRTNIHNQIVDGSLTTDQALLELQRFAERQLELEQ